MVRNGDMIYGYTVLAVANGIALAHSQSAPDPYVVWHIDADGQCVYGGRYTADAEDAEWDFCAKAFPWFEDNVNINMIEDEDELKDPAGFIRSARRAVSDAAKIIDDLISKMDDEKNAPQEDTVEQIYGMLERINENSANRCSGREAVSNTKSLTDEADDKKNAPQEENAEQTPLLVSDIKGRGHRIMRARLYREL